MNWLTCSLDIWNGYIKWLIFLKEYDDTTNIIAKDMIKSSWLKRWKILDSNNLTNSILKIIDNLSKKVDSPIDNVIIWFSHPDMKVIKTSNHKRIVNVEINEKDVSSLLESIPESIDELNYEILKIIPSIWIIDDTEKTKNPIWLQGRKLELKANVFMIPSNIFKELEKIFDKLEMDVIDFMPNILWLEEWCLDSENKDLWCVLIDIGTNQTSYVMYEEWNNLWYGIIPVWWEEITKDISIWLKIDYTQAEQIKKEEWEIIINNTNIDTDGEIDKVFLSNIIEARLEDDIYKYILEEMEEKWVSGRLPWWIILSWWTGKIKNIEEFTRNYFSLACKRWKIVDPQFQELWTNLQFLNCIWNYIWEEKYWDEWWFSLWLNFWFLTTIKDWIKKIF